MQELYLSLHFPLYSHAKVYYKCMDLVMLLEDLLTQRCLC